ncbi:MAG: glycosyltransferase family 39 protein [Nannocystaceae bacterium]|nr:glycosyltransferase family 39 protein [Nannocystaceae bacterium]
MTSHDHAPSPRERTLAQLALAAIVIGSLWLRWPGLSQGGFASHDVGGILYNAMLLARGELPYVADIELKAPGSFYLAWVFAGDRGTDIAQLQVWANLWAIAGQLALASIAWRHVGPRAAVVAAALLALVDAHLDSMDANYVTWAQLPQILAMGWGLAAARCHGAARTLGFVIAGALGGFAAMVKQPSGVVLLALGLCALPRLWSSDWRACVRTQLAIAAGAIAVHVPLVLHYAAAGELSALLSSYPLNRWGLSYVTAGGREHAWPMPIEGALATIYFLALPLVPAAFAAAAAHRRGPAARSLAWPLVIWLLCTIAQAWVGARFYKGYFLAAAPPAALLAALPWGVFGPGLSRRARAALLLPVLLLGVRQVRIDRDTRFDRSRPHDAGARAIAKHLQGVVQPGDRIWVWGWHLWDLYALLDAVAPTRIYKSLGLIEPPNDDTWRLPATPLRFVDGEYPRMLVQELRADPPAVIVLGSTVPQRDFAALRELLREQYVRDGGVKMGKLELWRRRDRAGSG